MEWDASNQRDASNVINDESKHQNFQSMESDISLRTDGAASLLAKRTILAQDQLHQLGNFLGQPAIQSSVVGSSCATTTSVHSTSAPMHNSTCYYSRSHAESGTSVRVEPLGDVNVNSLHIIQRNMEHLSYTSLKDTNGMLIDQKAIAAQASTSAIDAQMNEHHLRREKQGHLSKETNISGNPSYVDDSTTKERGSVDNVHDIQAQNPLSKNPSSDVKLEPFKPEKQEKVTSGNTVPVPRKKNYDPDLF